MNRTLAVASVALLLAAIPASPAERKLGEALDPDLETTSIGEILAQPEDWVGRTVRIEGRVAKVCTRQGCWMDLVSPDGQRLQVKVDDGVIVFPLDAVGLQAVAEGEVEILEMSREQYVAWRQHVAVETGKEFDPAQVGEAPYRIVRLRGRGAEIRDA